jgi:hypothetical protein
MRKIAYGIMQSSDLEDMTVWDLVGLAHESLANLAKFAGGLSARGLGGRRGDLA